MLGGFTKAGQHCLYKLIGWSVETKTGTPSRRLSVQREPVVDCVTYFSCHRRTWHKSTRDSRGCSWIWRRKFPEDNAANEVRWLEQTVSEKRGKSPAPPTGDWFGLCTWLAVWEMALCWLVGVTCKQSSSIFKSFVRTGQTNLQDTVCSIGKKQSQQKFHVGNWKL